MYLLSTLTNSLFDNPPKAMPFALAIICSSVIDIDRDGLLWVIGLTGFFFFGKSNKFIVVYHVCENMILKNICNACTLAHKNIHG